MLQECVYFIVVICITEYGGNDERDAKGKETKTRQIFLSKDVILREGILWHLCLLELLVLLGDSLHAGLVAASLGIADVGTGNVGTDKLWVLKGGLATKGAIKDTDGVHDEARSNLDKGQVGGIGDGAVLEGLFCDLVVAEPDTVVDDREGEDVVDKGFDPAGGLWDSKDLCEELLHQQPVWRTLKVLVE